MYRAVRESQAFEIRVHTPHKNHTFASQYGHSTTMLLHLHALTSMSEEDKLTQRQKQKKPI
jgi:hypothetical protein